MFEQLIQQVIAELQRRQQLQAQGVQLPTEVNNAVPMLAPVSGITDPSLFGLFDIPPRQINPVSLGATPQRDINTTVPNMPVRYPVQDTSVTVQPSYAPAARPTDTGTGFPTREMYSIPDRPVPTNDPYAATREEVMRRMARHSSGGIFPLMGF